MNKDFDRFKKRVWRDVFIKCGAAGLAAGFFAVAIVLLALRLCNVDLLWAFYLLIGLCGCAAGFGIAFLLLRTDDGKIAKRLDAELGLSERAQTALYYEGAGGDMIEALCDDASAALARIPTKILPFRHLAVTITNLCVFAASVCLIPIFALTVNAADVPQSPTEPVYDVTDWEWDALDELIDYVKASRKADAYLRAGATAQLETLRALLVGGVSKKSLPGFVRSTASEIRNIVKDANDRDGVTSEQKNLNTEESNYIVGRLFEIFGLTSEAEGGDGNGDENGDGNDDDDEEKNPDGSGGTGTGKLNIDDTPFFDPEKGGYVKLGEVRDEYYAKAQQALAEGVISQEEWEYIVATYFSDLTAKQE